MRSNAPPGSLPFSSCACRLVWFFSIAILTFWIGSQAVATISVQGSGGAGVGILKAHKDFTVQAYPLQMAVRYEFRPFNVISLNLGSVIERQSVTYKIANLSYEGLNLLAGGSLGLNILTFKRSFLRSDFIFYPQSELTLATENTYTVNGGSFRHSTLRTYKSSAATQVDLSYIFELTETPFDKHERGRWGLTVSYLNQPLSYAKTNIATSNRALGPKSESIAEVDYSYSLISLRLLFGFSF